MIYSLVNNIYHKAVEKRNSNKIHVHSQKPTSAGTNYGRLKNRAVMYDLCQEADIHECFYIRFQWK